MGENNNQSNSTINTKDFVIGTLIGGIIGAGAALVLAPKSGRELRGDINQGASQVKGRAYEWKDIAAEKSTNWKDRAYTTGSELKRKAMDTTTNASAKTKDLTKTFQDRFTKKSADQKEDGEVGVSDAPTEEYIEDSEQLKNVEV
ncbi:YtxH domain-containing protein [Virgibacillus xinjiangensis]|uniref:YtxH domain-containing protein n=1 Tax=Virgibacillus xinjiangensis TaxID=393090 RepID=A0ABV7CUQ0_9BACI